MSRAIPKPESRKREKARADRIEAQARKACRLVVIERAGGQCQRCGAFVSDDLPEWHRQRAHVNETRPRSLGGDATDADTCELLCADCHFPNGQHAPTAERHAILTTKGASKWN